MIREATLKLSCGCRVTVLGEHLHMTGCSSTALPASLSPVQSPRFVKQMASGRIMR
jgi:hypothetical protein